MYSTEEEQLESIKKWWHQYGLAACFGLLLGLAIIISWRYYRDYQVQQSQEASALYQSSVQDGEVAQLLNDDSAKVLSNKIDEQLLTDYSGTPYAVLGAFRLAKLAVDHNDLAAAQTHLRWVLANSSDKLLQNIAAIRLSRVLLATDNADEALKLIKEQANTDFAGILNEVEGDILLSMGKVAAAKKAYEQALAHYPEQYQYRNIVQMKADDLNAHKPMDSEL